MRTRTEPVEDNTGKSEVSSENRGGGDVDQKYRIEHYCFGSMQIGGKLYNKDLIIFPGSVRVNWRRREGHVLNVADLQEILDSQPELVIIGTGASGQMQIHPAARKALEERGIRYVVRNTEEAKDIYNRQIERVSKVVGAFHLTC